MKLVIPKIKNTEYLFFLSYGIMLVFGILSGSLYYRYFVDVYKYIILCCCFLLVINEILIRKITYKEIAGLLVCILLFFIVYFSSKGAAQNAVASIFLYSFSARRINFKKISIFTLYISIVLLAFIIFSSYIGLIKNVLYPQSGRNRYCLGFRYVLNAPTILFNIVALILYLKKNNIKLNEIFILFCANSWLFFKTDSRSTAILITFMLLFSLIAKFTKDSQNRCSKLYCFLIPIFAFGAVLSIVLTTIYNSNIIWMNQLNGFLGNRLRLGQNMIILNGIHLFGNNLSMVGNGMDAYGVISTEKYSYVDSFYVQILIHYGIIFTIVLIFVLSFAMIQAYKNADKYLMVVFSVMALHFTIDDLQINLCFNTFWLIVGSVLIDKLSVKLDKNEKKLL